MNFKNIFINGLRVPIPQTFNVQDILERFFNLQCEFIVCVNSKALPCNKYDTFLIKENDKLQIIAYSKHCYKAQKRTIFRQDGDTQNEIFD